MTLDYRMLQLVDEFEALATLEAHIWGAQPRELLPPSLLRSLADNGALILGAYDQAQMVGFAVAVVARHNGEFDLWSYGAGVHPDYQRQGIGWALKAQQRAWAREQGYNTIRWTYDPLQRGNANFNLHLLGVSTKIYHINYYGDLQDTLNAGMPSDRLEVIWRLDSGRVVALMDTPKEGDAPQRPPVPGTFMLTVTPDGAPEIHTPLEAHPAALYAEIPQNIAKLRRLRPALAYAWRMALREVLLSAFALGYSAVDFVEDGARSWYVLREYGA